MKVYEVRIWIEIRDPAALRKAALKRVIADGGDPAQYESNNPPKYDPAAYDLRMLLTPQDIPESTIIKTDCQEY